MIVCPVCEHQQPQGNACDVCGKELVPAQPVQVVSETLPELESNSLPGGSANVVVERLPDLDEYRAGEVQVAPEAMPDMETTHFAGVAVAADPCPDMERTHFEGDGQRTPKSNVLRCRYCGQTQQSGVLCNHCGVRLPGSEPGKPKAAAANANEINCPTCGVPGNVGTRCLACGAYIKTPKI